MKHVLPVLAIALSVFVAGCDFESDKPLLNRFTVSDSETYPENISMFGEDAIGWMCSRADQNVYTCSAPDPNTRDERVLVEYQPLPTSDPKERRGFYLAQTPAWSDDPDEDYYYFLYTATSRNDEWFAIWKAQESTPKVTSRPQLFALAMQAAQKVADEGLKSQILYEVLIRRTMPGDARWFEVEKEHSYVESEIRTNLQELRDRYEK